MDAIPQEESAGMGMTELEIGRLQGAMKAGEDRIARLEQSVDARFVKFESKIDGMDCKLDALVGNAEIRKALAVSNARALSTIKWLIGVALTVMAAYFGTHHFDFSSL